MSLIKSSKLKNFELNSPVSLVFILLTLSMYFLAGSKFKALEVSKIMSLNFSDMEKKFVRWIYDKATK